jgi:hypothetical protein
MAYLGTLLGLVPFLVLLFPTGRLLSRRWRLVAWAIGLVLGLYLTAVLLTPGPIDLGLRDNPDNPLGVKAAEGLLQLVQTTTGVVAPVLVLAALASVVVRFRRARGEERQQLKWFTFVIVADLVLFLGLAERVGPLGGLVIFPVGLSMIPVAIGVAVLRYRLYDIDRIINRTLVYALLTALLGAVYAGSSWSWGRRPAASPPSRRAGRSPPPPWPPPPCSSRPAAASNRRSTAGSTGAGTTRPRPSRRSPPACVTRLTWTPSQLSCWRSRRAPRADRSAA